MLKHTTISLPEEQVIWLKEQSDKDDYIRGVSHLLQRIISREMKNESLLNSPKKVLRQGS